MDHVRNVATNIHDLDLNNALVVVIIKNQVEKFWVLHNQFGTILNLNIVNLEVRYAIFGNSNERTVASILNEELIHSNCILRICNEFSNIKK